MIPVLGKAKYNSYANNSGLATEIIPLTYQFTSTLYFDMERLLNIS